MGAIPFWDDSDYTWDTVVLGGAVFPGLATVGGDKERKVDIKGAKGSDGCTLTDNGYDGAKVTIEIRIHTREQWDLWQLIFPLIDPRSTSTVRNAFALQAPAPNAIGITKVYIKKIGVPELKAGVLAIKLDAVEWFPAPKKVPAKTASPTGITDALKKLPPKPKPAAPSASIPKP